MKISKPGKRLIVMRRDSEEKLRQILKDISKIECEDIECEQRECPFCIDGDYGDSCIKDLAGEILNRLSDDFVIVRSPDCKIVVDDPDPISTAVLPVKRKRKYA